MHLLILIHLLFSYIYNFITMYLLYIYSFTYYILFTTVLFICLVNVQNNIEIMLISSR